MPKHVHHDLGDRLILSGMKLLIWKIKVIRTENNKIKELNRIYAFINQ